MAEYIERDAAANIFEVPMWRGYSEPYTFEAHLAMVAVAKLIREEIGKIPAADVAPVRHGQWERIGIRDRKGLTIYPCCSACGMVSAAYRSEWEGSRGAWKFCPNCGAKMGADT